jgi:spermidine/putrescine transport system permease protein
VSLIAGLGGGGGVVRPPQARATGRGPWALISPGLVYLLVFFVVPVGSLLAMSLYVRVAGAEMGVYEPGFRWQNYAEVLRAYWPHILRSFAYAAIATAATLLIGYPMAYAIAVRARAHKLLQGVLLVLVIAPFFTSFILRTVAWKQILADEGPVVAVLRAVHLLPADGRLTATAFAVVCGLTYNFLPFMVLPVYASLERLDPALLEAGHDLYASPIVTFCRVTLPLSLPGVVSGTLLVFIPASGDYVNSTLLGNPNTKMIGNVVDSHFFTLQDYPTAAATSAILMVIILVLVTVYVRRMGTEDLL